MKKLISTLGIGLFILTGCGASDARPFDAFAQCLSDKGAVMYGNDTCPHCVDQKKDFKGSFDKIQYVECDKDLEACQNAGVSSTPTWVIHNKNHIGRKKLTELSQIAGCPLHEGEEVKDNPVEDTAESAPTESTPL